jgi:hypothetical protein
LKISRGDYPERSEGSRGFRYLSAGSFVVSLLRIVSGALAARDYLIIDHEADGSERLWNHLPWLFLILPRYSFPWIDQMLWAKGKSKDFLSIALRTDA